MALDREIILVYGKTGMGKTRWTKQFLRDKPRVIVCDPCIEHDGLLFHNPDDLIDHLIQYPTFRVRYADMTYFPLMCEVALEVGRCWLVMEETERILPSSRQALPEVFTEILYRGRHQPMPERGLQSGRISVLMVAQRPSTVHIAARSQWNRIVTFTQTEDADIKWLESVSGFDLDPRTLRPDEYYEITSSSITKKILDDTRYKYGKIRPESGDDPNRRKGGVNHAGFHERVRESSGDDGNRAGSGRNREPGAVHS